MAPDGTLWLADRALPVRESASLDAASGEQRSKGDVDVGLPPFSIGCP
jgi:hypothetical protein